MQCTLAILICSLEHRRPLLQRLLAAIEAQKTPDVHVFVGVDRYQATTGRKRNNLLLEAADSAYCCFVDDDDMVSPNYVVSILSAIKTDPDCVGFKVRRFVDGVLNGQAIHSLRFARSQSIQIGNAWRYERVPNHLNPVRTGLALEVGFKDITIGEDHDYADRLRPLLKTESFIDDFLYDYLLVRTQCHSPSPASIARNLAP